MEVIIVVGEERCERPRTRADAGSLWLRNTVTWTRLVLRLRVFRTPSDASFYRSILATSPHYRNSTSLAHGLHVVRVVVLSRSILAASFLPVY